MGSHNKNMITIGETVWLDDDESSTYDSYDEYSDDDDDENPAAADNVCELKINGVSLRASQSTLSLPAFRGARQISSTVASSSEMCKSISTNDFKRKDVGSAVSNNNNKMTSSKLQSARITTDKCKGISGTRFANHTCPMNILQITSAQRQNAKKQYQSVVKPDDQVKSLMFLQGFEAKIRQSRCIENLFLEITEKNIAAYVSEVVDAFRRNDLDAIKSFHCQGRLLQCCNKFGESVIHLTCRRGSYDILKFLIDEAKVSILVRDDSGRTPLHDACWTSTPNYDLITLLLEHCPDLLLISDNRNFTPLNYVPSVLWTKWSKYLEEKKHLLRPKFFTDCKIHTSDQMNKRKRD